MLRDQLRASYFARNRYSVGVPRFQHASSLGGVGLFDRSHGGLSTFVSPVLARFCVFCYVFALEQPPVRNPIAPAAGGAAMHTVMGLTIPSRPIFMEDRLTHADDASK